MKCPVNDTAHNVPDVFISIDFDIFNCMKDYFATMHFGMQQWESQLPLFGQKTAQKRTICDIQLNVLCPFYTTFIHLSSYSGLQLFCIHRFIYQIEPSVFFYTDNHLSNRLR